MKASKFVRFLRCFYRVRAERAIEEVREVIGGILYETD